MKLDPVLLEILVCPDCKGPLTVDNDNDELICERCGLIYPVRDDIPVMLVEEARRAEPPAAVARGGAAESTSSGGATNVRDTGDDDKSEAPAAAGDAQTAPDAPFAAPGS